MFLILVYVAAACFLVFAGVYGLYFTLVIKTSKKKQYLMSIERALEEDLNSKELPNVSIIVPAYNEEGVISRKLENIASLSYPREKIEVILIDDCSTDKTSDIAEQMFAKLDLPGRIIKGNERTGVNASYNRGVSESRGDLILTTDADVMFDPDTLIKGVKIFQHLKDVGGVTGKMVTVSDDSTSAVVIEKSYRSFFDSSSVAESALYSTFPGYTCLTILKKSLFSPLPVNYGSSDGNISLATIKKGSRFLYVPNIRFYEPISVKIAEQRRQKMRRAARLIQSAVANKDMLFKKRYESFGRRVFPLRFAMLTICPPLILIGLAALFFSILYLSSLLGLVVFCLSCLLLFLGTRTGLKPFNLPTSFVIHQFYLINGLIFSRREFRTWKVIDRHPK